MIGNLLRNQRQFTELFFDSADKVRRTQFAVPQIAIIQGLGIFEAYRGSEEDDGKDVLAPANSNVRLRRVDPGISKQEMQGYLGLLTPFYFGGDATTTVITDTDESQWIDLNLTIDPQGTFDYRPEAMRIAQPVGYNESTKQFSLEGLTIQAFGSLRASMSFDPDEDRGQLEARLLFERHSGTTPSSDFPIEEVIVAMDHGASVDYTAEPNISFFVGDTIDTNGPGDAGKIKFQVKSTVSGIFSLRALTLYVQA